MSLFVRYYCIAHWLFVPFFETSRVSGNTNSWFTLSFLIIITMFTNNSSIFCSSLKFLRSVLLSGDGGTTTWTIFMCHLFFSCCWWDLICRFIVGTVFKFQVFFPTLNSLFQYCFIFRKGRKLSRPVKSPRATGSFPFLTDFTGSTG